jgi:Xaa-Pro aminopeptidase
VSEVSDILDELWRQEYQIEPIPTFELERRWKAVRKGMEKIGVDALITVNSPYIHGHYPQWFLGFQPHGYETTVIFPIEGEMIVVAHHHVDKRFLRGVRKVLVAPQVPTFRTAWAVDAVKAVEALKELRVERLGVVGLGSMPAPYYQYLMKHFPNLVIDEATDLVDELKAVKSDVELRLIMKTAAIDELCIEAAMKAIRPGRKVYEVMADIRHTSLLAGESADLAALQAGSILPGSNGVAFDGLPLWNHVIKKHEVFTLMIECAGPGGYYLEHARHFCVDFSPPKEFETLFDEVVKLQNKMASMYRPGADPMEILEFARRYQKERGLPEGEATRLIGHGQGLDLVERPALTPLGETMKLKANMVMSCHPGSKSPTYVGYPAWIDDDYLVTETGGVRLHKTPQEIFVVGG